jgi:predicted Zn-dependent protease
MNDSSFGSGPTSAAAYAEQAFYFIERRRLDDARRIIGQGLKQYPQDADLLFHSAQVDWLADRNKEAEDTVRQVLVGDPHHAPARGLLATLLTDRGEFADAELLLISLLRDYPENAALYGRYSRLMLQTLHLDKAEQLAREGLRYEPENDECLMAAALCDTARGGSGPNGELEKLMRAHPESLNTVHALVVALLDAGRINEAHRIAQSALRGDPANEHLVTLVRELRIQNHWSMKPLWPLQKWGWGASAVMWIGGIVLIQGLRRSAPDLATPVALAWLAYCIYSWVWPSLVRRIL